MFWAQSDLNGVWKIVEASGHNAEEGDWKWENIQPSLYIFYEGYYSEMYIPGNKARPLMPDDATPSNITEEQMRSIITQLRTNSGTYELNDSVITLKPIVAMWPNFMEGGSASWAVKLEGNAMHYSNEGDGWNWSMKLERLK